MAEKFQTVKGTISLLGNGITRNSLRGYTVLELIDENENVITLKNVNVSLELENYLSVNSLVELKIVKFSAYMPFFVAGNALYIYGIKLPNRKIIGHLPKIGTKRFFILGLLFLILFFPIGIYLLWCGVRNMSLKSKMNKDIE